MLDVVAQIQKYGLEIISSLPPLVEGLPEGYSKGRCGIGTFVRQFYNGSTICVESSTIVACAA